MSEPALSVRIRIIGSRARSIWPCALAACPVSAIPCHRGALGLVRRLPVCPLAGPAAIVHASAGAGEVAGGRGLRTATCTIHGRCRPCHCCPGGGGACWRQRRLLQLPTASRSFPQRRTTPASSISGTNRPYFWNAAFSAFGARRASRSVNSRQGMITGGMGCAAVHV